MTQSKAKCPGCGDEEGSEAISLISYIVKGTVIEGEWSCAECHNGFDVSDWLKPIESRTLTDADVEAVARRVVELMGEGS